MNHHRCETCDYHPLHGEMRNCPYDGKDSDDRIYYTLKEEMRLPKAAELFTSVVGCASHSEFICQGKKVMDLFVSLIISEMVYDDGDMYYKVNPEKYVEVLGRIVSGDEL